MFLNFLKRSILKERIILKLSGEALNGNSDSIIKQEIVQSIALEIQELIKNDIEVGIVVGGGNIWRGAEAEELGMDRAQADYMGMMATIMNSLALQDGLEKLFVDTRVQTTLEVDKVAEPYLRRRAIRHLEKGRVVIFAGGTGLPYFSTDTNTILKAAEISATKVLMAKNGVDGVYNKDPRIFADAKKYDEIKFSEVINQKLGVMDITAAALAEENNINIVVFNMNKKGEILKAAKGENVGTKISN